MRKSIFSVSLAALLLAAALPARAADPFRAPWDARDRIVAAEAAPDPSSESASADTLLVFYQKAVSPLSSGRCPMTPSCSRYSHECISRFGVLRGFIMTADRLVRCGRDEVRLSPRVWTESGPRTLDPVDRNNLWPEP
ncbi:MAG: membrane protein insertion efficiency factor YidD [Thermodesulfobacteriota bacterium]